MKYYFVIIIYFFLFSLIAEDNFTNYKEQIINIESSIRDTTKRLKSTLINALKNNDINEAIKVCNISALEITDLNESDDISIIRKSLKYRNDKNAPNYLEKEVLTYFKNNNISSLKSFEELKFIKIINENKIKKIFYMKAIPTKEICLTCHGKNIDEQLMKTIKSIYPNDRAIGYSKGDIRGAFVVYKKLKN